MHRTLLLLAAAATAAATTSCGASDQVGADEPGYYRAELSIVPLKYALDREGTQVVLEIQPDGTVLGKGEPIARIVGQEIRSMSGDVLLAVVPDDSVKGKRAPVGAHFDAKNRLVTASATVGMVRREIVGVNTRSGRRVNVSGVATDHGQAQVALQWDGGKRQVLAGYFDHFEWRATREIELLAVLFLMKPEALDHPPPG